MTTAGEIPQTWVTQAATITVTGRLRGTNTIGGVVVLEIGCDPDVVVERVKPDAD
jgi:hypothetical protein